MTEKKKIRLGLFSKSRSLRGMTLIELLISLAIIGMMAGIASPIFSYYQKRSNVDSDMQNFVSLFNYARALQDNPDNYSRSADQNYGFIIALTNNGDTHQAELYSSTDTATIIDSVNFSENISVKLNNISKTSDGLTMKFGGTPPKETIACSITSAISCDKTIEISLKTTGSSPVTKIATIDNTYTDPVTHLTKLLSIGVK